MTNTLYIPVLLGTARQGRRSERVAHFVMAQLGQRGIQTELLDPREMHLPADDDGLNIKNEQYLAAITKANALIIVSPEYNHSFPGTLKRVLDMYDKEYKNKPVGIVGVSDGQFGGVRMIEHLTGVLKTLGFIIAQRDLQFFNISENTFAADGSLADQAIAKRVDGFFNGLLELVALTQK